jgi:hypothetical protein
MDDADSEEEHAGEEPKALHHELADAGRAE